MSTTLKEILNIPACEVITLVAGKKGLKRQVKGTTISGSVDLIRYANEGDLDFVRASDIHSVDEAILFTKAAFKYKMAGLVFVLYKNFKKIPQDVIEFANEHDFPVFTIPWEGVKISTMARAISEMIIESPASFKPAKDILKSLLLKKEDLPLSDESKKQLSSMGFGMDNTYQVIAFKILNTSNLEESILQKVYKGLNRELSLFCMNRGIVVSLPSGIAAIIKEDSALMPNKNMIRLFNEITDHVQTNYAVDIRLGIGTTYHNIEKIGDSYDEAVFISNIASGKLHVYKRPLFFEYSGIYKFIWESKNLKSITQYCDEKIRALKIYDKTNDTDLMEFLVAYFAHNGSIKELSSNLHLHKNTVLYKIRKIESILACDFSKYSDLFDLHLALIINEIFLLTSIFTIGISCSSNRINIDFIRIFQVVLETILHRDNALPFLLKPL